MPSLWTRPKFCCLVMGSTLTRQLQILIRYQTTYDRKIEICSETGGIHFGKRSKCWLPAFSPFLTMFSKGFIFRVFKSRDYVVKT